MLTRDDRAPRRVAAGARDSMPPLDVESLQRRAEVERKKLRTMIDYAYYPRCRRQHILDYFGDEDWRDRDRKCGACDNCEAVAHGKADRASRSPRARRSAACCRSSARCTAGSGARGSRRSRTAATTTRGSPSCPSAAACAAGRRSRCSICCARSKAPGSSRRRAASTRRSRPRKRGDLAAIGKLDGRRARHPDADGRETFAQAQVIRGS